MHKGRVVLRRLTLTYIEAEAFVHHDTPEAVLRAKRIYREVTVSVLGILLQAKTREKSIPCEQSRNCQCMERGREIRGLKRGRVDIGRKVGKFNLSEICYLAASPSPSHAQYRTQTPLKQDIMIILHTRSCSLPAAACLL